MTLKEKIQYCLDTYGGGQEYFSALDMLVKGDKEILDKLDGYAFELYIENKLPHRGMPIVSGEFGLHWKNQNKVGLCVQGGLRHGTQIMDLSQYIVPNHHYLFFDDSYFLGRTAEAVKQEIERCGGIFDGCIVIYDGSKQAPHKVWSLYRYFDYFNFDGTPKNP